MRCPLTLVGGGKRPKVTIQTSEVSSPFMKVTLQLLWENSLLLILNLSCSSHINHPSVLEIPNSLIAKLYFPDYLSILEETLKAWPRSHVPVFSTGKWGHRRSVALVHGRQFKKRTSSKWVKASNDRYRPMFSGSATAEAHCLYQHWPQLPPPRAH